MPNKGGQQQGHLGSSPHFLTPSPTFLAVPPDSSPPAQSLSNTPDLWIQLPATGPLGPSTFPLFLLIPGVSHTPTSTSKPSPGLLPALHLAPPAQDFSELENA